MRRLMTAQSLAGLAGLTFVTLGVCGFVPGVVQEYGQLRWWRAGSSAELFGAFQTSILLNLAHLGFGTAGLAAARSWTSARSYLAGGGVACFALGIYGLLIDRLGDANVIPLDRPSIWLHVGLGVAMVYGGLAATFTQLQPATP